MQQRDVRQSGAQKEIGPDTTGNVNVVGALDSLEEGSLRESCPQAEPVGVCQGGRAFALGRNGCDVRPLGAQ